MSRSFCRFISILFTIVFAACPVPVLYSETAAASSRPASRGRVVRVFYPLQKGFTEIDADGHYGGYSYEYLMKIAQLTGWTYEFYVVEATNETLEAGLKAVKEGALDMAAGLIHLPELHGDYLYTSEPYGEASFTLITGSDNQALNGRTLYKYPLLRVALVEKASGQNTLFDDFCTEKGLSYQAIYAQNNDECRALVDSGAADAMISKDTVWKPGYRTILKFANQSFYFGVTPGNTELAAELDRALAAISVAAPDTREKLYREYFTGPSDLGLALTADEQEYLRGNPVVRVAVPVGRAPVQDYNPLTGQFSGILIDILKELSNMSGLHLKLLPAENSEHANEMIKSGAADIIVGLPYSLISPEKLFASEILLTSPVLSMPIVRVTNVADHKETDEILVYENIRMFSGREDVRYDDNTERILKLMEKGEAQEAYLNGYIAQHYLEQSNFHAVMLALTPYPNFETCLGIARSADLRLISILEQAISTLNKGDIERIVYQNTSHTHQTGILDVVRRNPVPYVLSALAVLTLISLLMFLLFLKSRRLNRLVSAERSRYKALSQTDGLTGVYNSAAFRLLSEEYLERESPPPAGVLIILDIDLFKTINDTYGHLTGDAVLTGLAELLKTIFRGDDFVGRLGGDEFGILMRDVRDPAAATIRCTELARRARTLIDDRAVTLSIGAASFADKVQFDELFRFADEALYDVKRGGRDGFAICNVRC